MKGLFGERVVNWRSGLWRRTAAAALLSVFGAVSLVQAQTHGKDIWNSIGAPAQSSNNGSGQSGSGFTGGSGTNPLKAIPIATFNGFTSPTDTGSGAFQAFSGTKYGISNGQLQVTFPPVMSGSAALMVLNNVNAVNFSTAGAASLTMTNPQSVPVTVSVWVVDKNNNSWRCSVTMPANSTQNYAISFANLPDPSVVGMASLPNVYPGYSTLAGHGDSIDWSNVSSIQMYSFGPTSAATIDVGTISLLPQVSLTQLLTNACSRWGQSTVTTNENPTASDSDLVQRLASEQTALAGPSALSNVDTYGGSTALPAQTATGKWQLKQVNGKWWFVTPLGHLYFMSGVDQVDPDMAATVITNKSYMFSSLPATTDPLAVNYGTAAVGGQNVQTYNFYQQNLQLKYQTASWQQPWLDMTTKRFKNWGFNSVGSYSEWTVANTNTLPYLAPVSLTGVTATIPSGNNIAAAQVPDPYDPTFRTVLQANLANSLNTMRNDPMLVGFYTGIELGWTGPDGPNSQLGLAFGVMNSAQTEAAHVVLTQYLQRKYRSRITRLNAYWRTNFKSFNDVKFALGYQGALTPYAVNDLTQFERMFAAKFFQTANQVIKAQDPNYLYLGTELSHYAPFVMDGAKGNLDAMCVNRYDTSIPTDVIGDAANYNIPVLITEFDFGSTESGMWGGGIAAQSSEATRDSAAVSYLSQALAAPNVVGANWYQYVDQPLVGGAFGSPRLENYNEGLVDQTDTPYAPLIAALKQFHSTMYSTRWNN